MKLVLRLQNALLMLALCAAGVWAQGTTPAGSGGRQGETGQEAITQRAPTTVLTEPLSGAMQFSPGVAGVARSFILPSLQYTAFADTNGSGTSSGPKTIDTRNTLIGNLTLQRVWNRAQFNLEYAGGGFIYNRRYDRHSSQPLPTNGIMHEASVFQSFNWRHWGALIGDSAVYLPESAFGFSGFNGLGSFGGGLGGGQLANVGQLGPMFTPNQSILSGRARRVSNSSVVQLQFNPSGRSALTATGNYGLLNFLDPGYIDSYYWAATAGYSHAITPKDQIAVNYIHYWLRFKGINREILNRGIMLAYGRRLSGRLALELSAGGLVNMINKPLGGASTHMFWTTYDSLNYRFRQGELGLSFSRYMNGGAGLLPGAETTQEQLTFGHQLTRRIFSSLNFGHAFNQSLSQDRVANQRFKYEAWHGGVGLSRSLGERTSIYVSYNVQRQISSNPLCFGNSCGTVYLRQVGGLGVNWHGRPIKID